MGMFDYVFCEYPLPDLELQNEEFQTKDIDDPVLDKYRITASGTLMKTVIEYATVPESERPYYGKPEWDEKPMAKWYGSRKIVNEYETEMVDYTGVFSFYTLTVEEDTYEYIDAGGGIGDVRCIGPTTVTHWFEYDATFCEGKLIKLERGARHEANKTEE